MNCGDNKKVFQNKNFKRKPPKQEQSKQRPLQRFEVGSGVMREGHSLRTGHARNVLFVLIGKREKSIDNSVINNALTVSMKNVSQHLT